MTKDKLQSILLGTKANIFAVIDGASVERLPQKLFEMRPPNHCLTRGELAPDVAETSGYLVGVIPGTDFADWLFSEAFGKHCCIFAVSNHSLTEMRKHFRALRIVHDEEGNPLIFRFYDPRVLQKFLPTCNTGELKTFFGKVDAFYAETDNGKLTRFRVKSSGLDKTDLDEES